MSRVYNFLSSRTAAGLFLIVSIACRVLNVLYTSFVHRDKVFLALQSKSLLDGHGLTIPKYYTYSINTAIYDPTPNWPPGYPVLLAPFLKLFNYDIYWATTTLEIIACILFIFIVRRIALQLKYPMAAVNILTLVAGCFNYQFITQSLPTDTSAFVIFLFGLAILLNRIQQEKFETMSLLGAALLLFIPCVFRYSYPPLSIAAFLAIVVVGLYLKNRRLVKQGLIGLLCVSVLLIGFLIFLKQATGTVGYIVETERGFFPKQLLELAPVAPGAFIDPVFTTSQMTRITGLSVQQSLRLLEIINILMITGLLLIVIYLFFRKKFFRSLDPFKWFLVMGIFISVATYLSLGYLTLTYKPQPGWGNYLGEARYFMFVTLFLQIIFIGWVFLYSSWKKNVFQKMIVAILSLLLFIEIAHNIYFHTKFALRFDEARTASYSDPDYVYFGELCKELIRDNPGTEVIVASDSDEYFRLMASYFGQKGLYDGSNLLKSLPEIKRKTILIIAIYNNEIPAYEDFLSSHNAKLLNSVNNANFYRIDLMAN